MKWNQKHSQEYMFSIIESYYQSSDTQNKVCERESIKIYTLKSWIKKYRISKGLVTKRKSKSKVKTSKFIELEVKASPSFKTISLDISYPNGVKLKVDSKIDINELSSLIKLY